MGNGRWGGRGSDKAGSRDEWSEEARKTAAEARRSGGGHKPFGRASGLRKAPRALSAAHREKQEQAAEQHRKDFESGEFAKRQLEHFRKGKMDPSRFT